MQRQREDLLPLPAKRRQHSQRLQHATTKTNRLPHLVALLTDLLRSVCCARPQLRHRVGGEPDVDAARFKSSHKVGVGVDEIVPYRLHVRFKLPGVQPARAHHNHVRFMLHNEVTHAVGVPLLAWVLKNVAPRLRPRPRAPAAELRQIEEVNHVSVAVEDDGGGGGPRVAPTSARPPAHSHHTHVLYMFVRIADANLEWRRRGKLPNRSAVISQHLRLRVRLQLGSCLADHRRPQVLPHCLFQHLLPYFIPLLADQRYALRNE
mmetsp:Transcript_34901/g.62229  ORF Transcript_34901/g.62229 Transcript_34901/m.62229 type:complete len:263 (+) Transcript_34901:1615-2403(+)